MSFEEVDSSGPDMGSWSMILSDEDTESKLSSDSERAGNARGLPSSNFPLPQEIPQNDNRDNPSSEIANDYQSRVRSWLKSLSQNDLPRDKTKPHSLCVTAIVLLMAALAIRFQSVGTDVSVPSQVPVLTQTEFIVLTHSVHYTEVLTFQVTETATVTKTQTETKIETQTETEVETRTRTLIQTMTDSASVKQEVLSILKEQFDNVNCGVDVINQKIISVARQLKHPTDEIAKEVSLYGNKGKLACQHLAHSVSDTFSLLKDKAVDQQPKIIAVGKWIQKETVDTIDSTSDSVRYWWKSNEPLRRYWAKVGEDLGSDLRIQSVKLSNDLSNGVSRLLVDVPEHSKKFGKWLELNSKRSKRYLTSSWRKVKASRLERIADKVKSRWQQHSSRLPKWIYASNGTRMRTSSLSFLVSYPDVWYPSMPTWFRVYV
ncbi:Hypothetical protein PP7435_CHR3-0782 [Komagataella phaffii CBS 7435]|uniref:Uncharacterized protein n=1 Tax=Komagataella phaffii (strain ATCC 76273 / CBS 7435 / CECT 11047 / NRRL Y-11430 / Wegner 21-1) TaxID=981350 RepID=F2QWF8_KOMPC|nr:GQ67_03500T0 [Komagataella phaffii]AOA68775.1 GQ68_03470T0 [Komagataella phaffii GS115]CAH2449764.1 Hypothetical protein BQ9382_C3-4100 [Komagataella phaffii CBS 7435]CCA39736.1 Hypothetical protein PP7435_CHR3-0782 [Komagataella phaffii CBS 7435]